MRSIPLLFALLSFSTAALADQMPLCLNAMSKDAKSNLKFGDVNPWRPKENGSVRSTNVPVTIHFLNGVTPEYTQKILKAAETAWTVEVGKMGFRKPLPDGALGGDSNLDIYIVDNLAAGVGGYTGFTGYGDPDNQTGIAYILVSNVLTDRYLRGVIAHEMFHAVQMAYNWWENLAFMEGTATWVVNNVVPDEDFYWHYFPYYNKFPQRSLDFVDTQSPYQYGTALWYTYLDERFSKAPGDMIRKIWEETAAHPDGVRSNFFRSMASAVGGLEALRNAWVEFSGWQILLGVRDDRKHFKFGKTWDASVSPYIDATFNPTIEHAEGTSSVPIDPYGHAFLTLGHFPKEPVDATIKVKGQAGADYQYHLIARSGPTSKVLDSKRISDDKEAVFVIQTNEPVEELILAVSNLGTTDLDLDYGDKIGRTIRYGIENRRPVTMVPL